MQEFLVYVILAFIAIMVIWWVIKIFRGFTHGYRSVDQTDLHADVDKDRM